MKTISEILKLVRTEYLSSLKSRIGLCNIASFVNMHNEKTGRKFKCIGHDEPNRDWGWYGFFDIGDTYSEIKNTGKVGKNNYKGKILHLTDRDGDYLMVNASQFELV